MPKKLAIYTLLIVCFFAFFAPVYSQSVDDLEDQLNDISNEVKSKEGELANIQKEIENIKNSTASIEDKLELVEKQLSNVKKYSSGLSKDISSWSKLISQREALINVEKQRISIVSATLYKNTRLGILDYFFMDSSGEGLFKKLLYKTYVITNTLEEMKNIKQEYAELVSQKQSLENSQKTANSQLKELQKIEQSLIIQKSELNSEIAYKNTQTSKIKNEVTLLKNQISDLQVAILLAKSGQETGIGSVPSSGDFDATYAGFMQKAPYGYFATFSFGAYTHRRGMSQYGAQTRADIGNQNHTQILQAYYGKSPVKRNTSGTIKVEGYGSMDFETKYLYGIAEMPSDWEIEALKAQAIAARTYAYNYYYNKTAICTTQSCQVWSQDKYYNVMNGLAPKWKQAVDETKGYIISGVSTQYSAITGGYLETSGWDTTDKKGGTGDWTSRAWESMGNSPWFYKAWYTKTYSDASPKCSRKPWMSEEEMADILNAYLVVKGIDLKGAVNTARVLPITLSSCPISGISGNPYSINELKSLINNPVTDITGNPVVTNNNYGTTTKVSFATNRGVINITGEDYKQIFNMRAPGYISVPQNDFVFINVVRK